MPKRSATQRSLEENSQNDDYRPFTGLDPNNVELKPRGLLSVTTSANLSREEKKLLYYVQRIEKQKKAEQRKRDSKKAQKDETTAPKKKRGRKSKKSSQKPGSKRLGRPPKSKEPIEALKKEEIKIEVEFSATTWVYHEHFEALHSSSNSSEFKKPWRDVEMAEETLSTQSSSMNTHIEDSVSQNISWQDQELLKQRFIQDIIKRTSQRQEEIRRQEKRLMVLKRYEILKIGLTSLITFK
jgi:hypothetical protein